MPTQNAPRRLTEGYIKGLTYKTRAFAVRDTAVRGLLIDVNKLSKSYKVQKELWVTDLSDPLAAMMSESGDGSIAAPSPPLHWRIVGTVRRAVFYDDCEHRHV